MNRDNPASLYATLLLLTTAIALSSCDHKGQNSTAPGTPAISMNPSAAATAAATASASAQDGALAAYRAMWRAFIDASDAADPDAPALAQYTDGDALTLLRKGIVDMQNKGLINTGDVKLLNPRVTAVSTSATPIQVQISDCVDTSATHLVKKDGSAYNDTAGGRRAMQIAVTQQADGGWKVSGFGLHEVGSC